MLKLFIHIEKCSKMGKNENYPDILHKKKGSYPQVIHNMLITYVNYV